MAIGTMIFITLEILAGILNYSATEGLQLSAIIIATRTQTSSVGSMVPS